MVKTILKRILYLVLAFCCVATITSNMVFAQEDDAVAVRLLDANEDGELTKGEIIDIDGEQFYIVYISGSQVECFAVKGLSISSNRQSDTPDLVRFSESAYKRYSDSDVKAIADAYGKMLNENYGLEATVTLPKIGWSQDSLGGVNSYESSAKIDSSKPWYLNGNFWSSSVFINFGAWLAVGDELKAVRGDTNYAMVRPLITIQTDKITEKVTKKTVNVNTQVTDKIQLDKNKAFMGEKVTYIDTPEDGYVLNRVEVKDSQNNIIQTTGNSFIMPDSDVEINAYFDKEYSGVVGITLDAPKKGSLLGLVSECVNMNEDRDAIDYALTWEKLDASEEYVETSGIAQPDTIYRAVIKLTTDENEVFADSLTVQVNEEEASVVSRSSNEIIVTYEFPATDKVKLTSITEPTGITVANGTAYADMELPTNVAIVTEGNTETTAAVVWDTTTPASGSYNPEVLTEQSVTLNGTVTCPSNIDQNGVKLTTTITVTIRAAGIVGTPTFTPAEGTYTENQSVTLVSSTDGATIYYTTDGTTPTTDSNVYSGAISVTGTAGKSISTTIKAIAVKSGMQNSSVASSTYVIELPAPTPRLNLHVKAGATKVTLSWNKVKGADGYYIYGNKCGPNSVKKIKTIKKSDTLTWTQKNLKKGKTYKYKIQAYKKTANGVKILKTSVVVHEALSGSKYTNAKKVTANFTTATLKKGKTKQIKAKIFKQNPKKKLVSHEDKFRYRTNNSKVATVSKSGKIKAVGKGKCNIYAYANNGVYKKLTITVK